jgi:hypothetical protein
MEPLEHQVQRVHPDQVEVQERRDRQEQTEHPDQAEVQERRDLLDYQVIGIPL